MRARSTYYKIAGLYHTTCSFWASLPHRCPHGSLVQRLASVYSEFKKKSLGFIRVIFVAAQEANLRPSNKQLDSLACS